MTTQEIYQKVLQFHINNAPILTGKEIHPDIPTMHNFTNGYHSSVRHCGFGLFIGRTPSGKFSFDGGSSMMNERLNDSYLFSWTPLRASQEVLDELGYDRGAVEAALRELAMREATP